MKLSDAYEELRAETRRMSRDLGAATGDVERALRQLGAGAQRLVEEIRPAADAVPSPPLGDESIAEGRRAVDAKPMLPDMAAEGTTAPRPYEAQGRIEILRVGGPEPLERKSGPGDLVRPNLDAWPGVDSRAARVDLPLEPRPGRGPNLDAWPGVDSRAARVDLPLQPLPRLGPNLDAWPAVDSRAARMDLSLQPLPGLGLSGVPSLRDLSSDSVAVTNRPGVAAGSHVGAPATEKTLLSILDVLRAIRETAAAPSPAVLS